MSRGFHTHTYVPCDRVSVVCPVVFNIFHIRTSALPVVGAGAHKMATVSCVLAVFAFDANMFRTTCAQSGFCAAFRPVLRTPPPPFRVVSGSVVLDNGVLAAEIKQDGNVSVAVSLLLRAAADDSAAPAWRLQILHRHASNDFAISRLVLPPTAAAPLSLSLLSPGLHTVRAQGGEGWWSEVELQESPFRLRLFVGHGSERPAIPSAVFNGGGLLRFAASDPSASELRTTCTRRGSSADSMPDGCTAVAADVVFPGALEAFGLPERAAPLALAPTVEVTIHAEVTTEAGGGATPTADGSDADEESGGGGGASRHRRLRFAALGNPYRLFNLDVFKYGPGDPVSLYGSLPYVLAQGAAGRAAGVLWLNAADTHVDVWKGAVDAAAGPGIGSGWLSEAGAVELLLFGGPSSGHVLRQLALTTGRPPMPPLWSLGYHQSHWNIKSQMQASALDRNFDRHGIPLDCLWLDIEHTDGKRYFTWDSGRFPSPRQLHEQLHPKGRRLVAIADPHLKADPKYELHATASARSWLVADAKNRSFTGKCWPGESSYLDLFQPEARAYWTSLYANGPGGEAGGAADGAAGGDVGEGRHGHKLGWPMWLHAWNDMNEPSVFESEELTLPRDARHRVGGGSETELVARGGAADPAAHEEPPAFVDVEHRVVHNAYGAMQASATYSGLLQRTNGTERPFLLSRSFFVGSQRFGAVWTGDNTASWAHLRLSFSMVLTLAISGHSFAGADVGGFFGKPSSQLLVRWYQAAAYLPFFRAHGHLDVPRREPFLLPPRFASAAAMAIRERQRLMPYWATLWYLAAESTEGLGFPIVAPPWVHFPPATAASATGKKGDLRAEGQWMVGGALLVQPVASPDVKTAKVHLPPPPSTWYVVCDGACEGGPGGSLLEGGTVVSIPTPLAATPRFQRGGTIIPRRERVRRSALLALRDPITLHVAPDRAREAAGQIFVDDGISTPRAPGSAATLTHFRLRGTVAAAAPATGTGGTGADARTEWELVATPRLLWGDAASAPADKVEAVLLRGVLLPHGTDGTATSTATAKLRLAGRRYGRAVKVHATAHGLLVQGLDASLQVNSHGDQKPGWTLTVSVPE
jgi:alpha-glucosidase (family GH31 glycosyl hydrolase)